MSSSILYILPVPRFFSQNHGQGGHVTHVQGVLNALRRAGYCPVIIAEEPSFALESAANSHVAVLPCGSRSLLSRARWSRRLVQQARQLRRENSFAFAYVRYSAGFAPWLPRLKRALDGVPLVLEVNSLGSQHHAWLRGMDRRALRAADLIICVSEPLREIVLQTLETSGQDRVICIPNGVDVDRFAAAGLSAAVEHPPTCRIGYTGIFKPHYGLEDLVAAFRLLQHRRADAELHLYGDGPHRPTIEQMAAGASNIHFHGMVDSTQVPQILAAMDVLVGTTSPRHRFQSPIKLYEYMAAGRPIVYARTPQAEKALGDGVRGLLYEIGNPEHLSAAIERLLNDPDLGRQLGQAAQAEATAHHSWDSRIAVLLSALECRSLLKNKQQSGDPLFVPSTGDFSLPTLWQWYLNVERELRTGLFDPQEQEYIRSYFAEAGLLTPARRQFFKRHYVASFATAAQHLLSGREHPVILDLGCGIGTQSLFLALGGARVVGIDMDETALAIFRQRIALYERISGRRLDIRLLAANCMDVDYAALAPIDGVYSMFAFNMMQPSAQLVGKLQPHLAPDCRWAMIDGNNRSWRARLLPAWRRQVWSPIAMRRVLETMDFEITTHCGGIVLPPPCWRLLPESLATVIDNSLRHNWLAPVSHQILATRHAAHAPSPRRRAQLQAVES